MADVVNGINERALELAMKIPGPLPRKEIMETAREFAAFLREETNGLERAECHSSGGRPIAELTEGSRDSERLLADQK
jgi:hypothetical protein